MSDIKLGVQLYTLREQCKDAASFEETLKFLQSIGADGIITDIPDVAYEVLNSQNKE